MNHPALIFRLLSTAWRRDTADESLEGLAADLAARVAGVGGFACLALLSEREAGGLYPLSRLLTPYGLSLYRRPRERGDGVYLFAQLEAFPTAEPARARPAPRFVPQARAA